MLEIGRSPTPVRGSVFKSLRFRLATWIAGTVVATALVTLLGLRQGVYWALLSEMDQNLLDDAKDVALELADADPSKVESLHNNLSRRAQGHRQQGWYVKFLDAEENLLWATAGARPITPKSDPKDDMTPLTSGEYQVVRHRLEKPVGKVFSFRVGAKLERIRADVRQIDRWVLLATGALLTVAPLCGYWLAGRAANTVGKLIDTAAQLRPEELSQRLPISGADDELDRLAHTVNGLLDRIATYLDAKRDFLANAAHELRTPLAAIRGSVEVALNGRPTAEDYEELLVDLLNECTSLEALVNQLLLLAETEADLPHAQLESVDLRPIVEKSVDMFRGAAEMRGIQLQTGTLQGARVDGRGSHLRQVLNNLLDNAVKYTPAGGRITVSLSADAQRQLAELKVADTGLGISAEEQRHIFERFFRAESSRSRTSGPGGTGLGLSICKSVVHNHGGEIECLSQGVGGTTFRVTLPLAEGGGDCR